MRRTCFRLGGLGLAAALLLSGCSSGSSTSPQEAVPDPSTSLASSSPRPSPADVKHAEVLAVGDIACDPESPVFNDPDFCRHEEVARLVGRLVKDGADWFVPLGDIQYESGALDAYNAVYDPWFGEFADITEPVPGNHEYYTDGAAGYFAYFGDRAGSPDHSWRSFSPVEGWRVYLLNSNCEHVGGCGPDSPQGRWLQRELAASDEPCAIAAWHHPLRSSGGYGGDESVIARAQPLWDLVDAGGVDIVLNGHEHIYERFAPVGGVTQFTVGTGGKEFYDIEDVARASQFRSADHMGVLDLDLASDSTFTYSFIDAATDQVVDSGKQACVNDPQ